MKERIHLVTLGIFINPTSTCTITPFHQRDGRSWSGLWLISSLEANQENFSQRSTFSASFGAEYSAAETPCIKNRANNIAHWLNLAHTHDPKFRIVSN